MGSPAVTITPDQAPQGVTITPDAPEQQPKSVLDHLMSIAGDLAKGAAKGLQKTVSDAGQFGPTSTYASAINLAHPEGPTPANPQPMPKPELPTTAQKVGYYGEGAAELAAPLIGGGMKAAEALPSAERAGAAFKDVMSAAKDVPVELPNAQDAILKMVDWQKKTQLGPTINKFLNRVTNPKLGDLTYEEARDFYQLLGRMSADETMKIAPAIRYDLTRMVAGLKQDVGNAAGTVGKAEQYFSAMSEFKNAKKLEDISGAAKEIILQALQRGLPIGFGGYAAKKLWDSTK